MMRTILFIVALFASFVSLRAEVTVEFLNPPGTIRDGVRDSLTVRFKVSDMDDYGPWAVTDIYLYEDDVFSDDLIRHIEDPYFIYGEGQWYEYTFSNVMFSNYEALNDGLGVIR